MIVEWVDGMPVRMRAAFDLSALHRWGRVFAVLDDQDSGNLCFGLVAGADRLFVKLAGAAPVRYDGDPAQAVHRLRVSADAYRALAHPSLVRLRESAPFDDGHALVFDWTDAVPLGRQYGRRAELDGLSVVQRGAAVQRLFDLHVIVAARCWVAVDLYDASVMIHPSTGRLTVCDIDLYQQAPVVNDMGRMWGSRRFMSPEEFTLGAELDEVTNVFALGALAHTLMGDDTTRSAHAWRGSHAQLRVAQRATRDARRERWGSVAALADAWRAASVSA